MKATFTAVWLLLVSGLSLDAEQLYLVAGCPTQKSTDSYRTDLLRVNSDATISSVATMAREDSGTWFIELSQLSRKLLAVSRAPDNSASVIDMDSGALAKKCKLPSLAGMSDVHEWLAEVPGFGLSLVRVFAGSSPYDGTLQAMVLDPAIGCAESFRAIALDESLTIVANGRAGVGDIGAQGYIPLIVAQDGALQMRLFGKQAHTEYVVPPQLRPDETLPALAGLLISSPDVLVLSVTGKAQESRLILFRKREKLWSPLPIAGDRFEWVRAFGHFLVIAEARRKGPAHRESAGPAQWRKPVSRSGPSVEAFLRESPVAFPGRIHIYDVESGQVATLRTDQADSEVLLIEGERVYYRISDRLYGATISGAQIENVQLLATSELVRDAHWAFVKR
jgi:hypothetical protein